MGRRRLDRLDQTHTLQRHALRQAGEQPGRGGPVEDTEAAQVVGAAADVEPLVEELSRLSPEFRAMWRDNDTPAGHADGVKHVRHPVLGPIAFEYSAFAVDGRTDLSLLVYNPATPADAERIASLSARF